MFRRTREPASSMATCWRRALEAALLGALLCAAVAPARAADDPKAASSELSNQAFALLNLLNAPVADGAENPAAKALLGPVATFAGDAQTLNRALGAGDDAGARHAAASLDFDAASIDAALKLHRGAIEAPRWDALKYRLAAIEKSLPILPSAPPGPASAAPPSVPPPTEGEPESVGATAPGAVTLPAPAVESDGPTIKIESRNLEGDVTHLKGYFEGSALRSAGIYEGAENLKPIKVDHGIGRQRVEFQLSLRDADIATNLRVIDQAGRMASVSVFADDSTATASTGTESGVEVDRGAGSTSGSSTAEIPSTSAPPPRELGSSGLEEPASRADKSLGGAGVTGGLVGRGIGAPMGDIQINIEAVNPINPLSHLYQVVGQITGHGLRRAGIYLDGRLIKRLPVSRGNLSNFATTFMMSGGTATIRAFGAGNQYVESSIAMPAAAPSIPPIVAAPYGMNPYAIDPYGSPYGASPSYGYNISPYGITRYPIGPYGASPYGAAPYGVNPYAAPINPYGNVPPMGPAGR